MRFFLFLLFLLTCPLASAGSFDFVLNELPSQQELQWNDFGELNSVVLREDGFESGGEFIVDFKEKDSFLFVDSFTESSFLFKALKNSTKELSLTAVGGSCKAIFYQSFGDGVQRHVFSSEGKVSFSLSEGDIIYFGLIPNEVGDCIVKFNDSNKFFSMKVSFKFYPPLYDFIEEKLFETPSCKQTFRNEETGQEVCYDDWMVWGCSNEEFLDGSEEAKLNCFVRQLGVAENQVGFLEESIADLSLQTEPELTEALKGLKLQVERDILSERDKASEQQSYFETLLGGVFLLLVGLLGFGYWKDKRDEDFVVREQDFVPEQLEVKPKVVELKKNKEWDWSFWEEGK